MRFGAGLGVLAPAQAALWVILTVAQTSAMAVQARAASAKSPAAAQDSHGPRRPRGNVSLFVDAPTTRGAWTMRVTNDGEVPVMIVADARLLTLDIWARGAHTAERCELPAEMRPQDDLGRPLVLPPGRTYAERFEPRMYCLEPARLDALTPGAVVIARLGWTGTASSAPVEIAPVEGMEPRIAPSKAIVSAPLAIPDEITPAFAPRSAVPVSASPRVDASLSLQAARSVDAASRNDIAIPVTLTNRGHRAAIVRFRPETLAFDVLGPEGIDHCGWPTLASAPVRDLFTTIGANRSIGLTVMLADYCPTRVFELPGFYVVRASLDTRRASGTEIGLRSFDGQLIAAAPTLVRLRQGTRQEPLVRPRLQPPTP